MSKAKKISISSVTSKSSWKSAKTKTRKNNLNWVVITKRTQKKSFKKPLNFPWSDNQTIRHFPPEKMCPEKKLIKTFSSYLKCSAFLLERICLFYYILKSSENDFNNVLMLYLHRETLIFKQSSSPATNELMKFLLYGLLCDVTGKGKNFVSNWHGNNSLSAIKLESIFCLGGEIYGLTRDSFLVVINMDF